MGDQVEFLSILDQTCVHAAARLPEPAAGRPRRA